MEKITKAQAQRLLTMHTTVFTYIHGSATDNYPINSKWMINHVAKDIHKYLYGTEVYLNKRNGEKKSYGVRFSGGSELRLYGTKDTCECYRGEIWGVKYVYIFGGFCHMIYWLVD